MMNLPWSLFTVKPDPEDEFEGVGIKRELVADHYVSEKPQVENGDHAVPMGPAGPDGGHLVFLHDHPEHVFVAHAPAEHDKHDLIGKVKRFAERWRHHRKLTLEDVMAAIDDLRTAVQRNTDLAEQVLAKLGQGPAGGTSDADVEAEVAALNAESDKMQAALNPPV